MKLDYGTAIVRAVMLQAIENELERIEQGAISHFSIDDLNQLHARVRVSIIDAAFAEFP